MNIRDYLVETTYYPVIGKYLEELDVELIKSDINKKCRPYITLLKGRDPIARGMREKEHSAGIKDVRQERTPRGFSPELFDDLNRWLESKGGARRDKSIIGTSGIPPLMFGNKFWIFPIGKFKYSYVKSSDLNFDGSRYSPQQLKSLIERVKRFGLGDSYTKTLSKEIEKNFGFNKGFDEAYSKKYEIWFQCKQYIFVPFKQLAFMDVMGYKGSQS